MEDLPVACSLIDAELRRRRDGLLGRLMALAEERREVADGAVLRFPGTAEVLALLPQVVAAERECCRFLRFRMTFEPDLGPIELEITGPGGTREFLAATFGL